MSKVNEWDIQGIAPDSAVTQNQLFDFHSLHAATAFGASTREIIQIRIKPLYIYEFMSRNTKPPVW